MKLMAVYGTLKKGFSNHRILENQKLLGSHTTEEKFTMHDLGHFPALTKDGKSNIHIEVYEVEDDALARVYRLEGYSGKRDSPQNWYDTMDVKTPWGNAEIFYFKGKPDHSNGVIEDGNWK